MIARILTRAIARAITERGKGGGDVPPPGPGIDFEFIAGFMDLGGFTLTGFAHPSSGVEVGTAVLNPGGKALLFAVGNDGEGDGWAFNISKTVETATEAHLDYRINAGPEVRVPLYDGGSIDSTTWIIDDDGGESPVPVPDPPLAEGDVITFTLVET